MSRDSSVQTWEQLITPATRVSAPRIRRQSTSSLARVPVSVSGNVQRTSRVPVARAETILPRQVGSMESGSRRKPITILAVIGRLSGRLRRLRNGRRHVAAGLSNTDMWSTSTRTTTTSLESRTDERLDVESLRLASSSQALRQRKRIWRWSGADVESEKQNNHVIHTHHSPDAETEHLSSVIACRWITEFLLLRYTLLL